MRVRSLLAVLAIAALVVVGRTNAVSATTIYDDFDGDLSKWTVTTHGTGAASVGASVLTISSTGDGSNDSLAISTDSWGYGTFTFEIGAGATSGANIFGIGCSTGGHHAYLRSDQGGWKLEVQEGSAFFSSDALAAPVAGDTYGFVWKSDSVDLLKNGVSVLAAPETSVIPTGLMAAVFCCYGNASGSFGSVSVSTVPEPCTVALLATGLFGLLCYASRKGK